MYLIVGLGNPGSKYKHTRHNMGFDTVDKLADSLGLVFDKNLFNGIYAKGKYFDNEIIILKPQTFMNLSGNSVAPIINYFKIPIEKFVVIYDDMDTPVGKIKLKPKGSSGGHNGIKSIIEQLGNDNFQRIKIGVGHPEYPNTIDFVLSEPKKEDLEAIDFAQKKAVEAIKFFIKENFDKAMSEFNKEEK